MEFRASRAIVETLREARSAGATVTLHLHGGASFTGVIRDVSEHQVVLAAPEGEGDTRALILVSEVAAIEAAAD